MWVRPRTVESEQVILDIGESGKTADRLQLYIDKTGELVFQVCGNQLRIPKPVTDELVNSWCHMALQAQVIKGQLQLALRVGTEMKWTDTFPYKGPLKIGERARLGGALSGGRGVEIHCLSLAAMGTIVPEEKLQVLMVALSERPKEFGLEHGPQ